MSNATPRPWRISEQEGFCAIIAGAKIANCEIIAECSGDRHEANAELIVCAVNSHDALVAALGEMLEHIVYLNELHYGKRTCNLQIGIYGSARAALAAAKESK